MSTKKKQKVLLIGWDAADWSVITPLLDEGKMPHLEKLVRNGVMGNLSTLYPVLSPMLWTSIATGKRAWKHGIHGFSEPDPSSGGARPVTNLGRKTKAIWNILNQQGLKSNVVGWWPSAPAEPINGVMVSNQYHQAHAPLDKPWHMPPGTVHPPRLIDPLKEFRVHPEEIEGVDLLPFVPKAADIDQDKDKHLTSVAKIIAECSSIHAAATAIMQLEEWDFMGVYFDAIDHFCHGFMKYHPPRLPWIDEKDFELYKDVVTGGYQFHDLMLGALMELAGPDTTIMICSDHGFHSDHLRPRHLPNEPAGPAEEHRHFGMLAAMGPEICKDKLVFGASLLDITPTILHLLDLPIGKDMDGKPLLSLFEQPNEVKYVDSWDEIEGDDGMHPPHQKIDPIDARESLQQLVDLGYIDGIDENKEKVAENTIKELRYNLARDFTDCGRHFDARPIFAELWEKFPDESRFGVHLFNTLLSEKNTNEAHHVLDKVVLRKKEYAAKAADELKSLQEEWKDVKELSKNQHLRLNKLRKQAGTNIASLAFMRGRLLYTENRYGEALVELKKAEKVQMHNQPSLYQQKGQILLAMHRWQDAEDAYKKVLDIDPINAQGLFGLAQSYIFRRDLEQQALDAITTSLGLIYHNPKAHYLCGVALQRLKRSKEAIQAFEAAVSQNPVYPAAHRRLAKLYKKVWNNDAKQQTHNGLARAAVQRIADVKAGKISPSIHDVELDVISLEEMASLGELGKLSTVKKRGALAANELVIVSGLPRSGTSMMMQMLQAGGLSLLTDNKREANEDNIKGYFEYEQAKKVGTERLWLDDATGKAVKIVAQLLPNLHPDYCYRIIFMERPLNEVLASQDTMLARSGKKGGNLSKRRLANTYIKHIKKVKDILASHTDKLEVLSINYHDALEKPDKIAQDLNTFLGGQYDEISMMSEIDPKLRRQFSDKNHGD